MAEVEEQGRKKDLVCKGGRKGAGACSRRRGGLLGGQVGRQGGRAGWLG